MQQRNLTTGVLSAGVGLAAILMIILIRTDVTLGMDRAWMDAMLGLRPIPGVVTAAHGFNVVGGGPLGSYIIPIGIAVALVIARRRWAAAYFLAASIGSTLCVQLIKKLFGRARPEEILVHSDYGSLPSGHTANAATMFLALGLILASRWLIAVGAVYTVLMMVSRTVLGAHWLSDTITGALIGVLMGLVIWMVMRFRVRREYPIPA